MSDKYDRNSELDEILDPAIKARPKRDHLIRWQSAVRFELQQRSWFRRQIQSLPQIAAGIALGFLIAAWYFHSSQVTEVADSVEPSATILYVFAKAN